MTEAIEDALRASPVFSTLGRIGIRRLARECRMQRLTGGSALYEEGTPAEALYLLAHGRMRSEKAGDQGVTVLRELSRGESMGGLSLLAGKPHRATLRAVRDCEIVIIPLAAIERLLYRHPTFGREAVRRWLSSVLYSQPPRPGSERRSARTLAVVPAHDGAPVEVVADALLKALRERGTVARIDGECIDGPGLRRQCQWRHDAELDVETLDSLEREFTFVVYMARANDDEWCARSLRQADRIVVVASSGTAARVTPLQARLQTLHARTEPEMVIVGDGRTDPLAWREICGARMHHRVRVGEREGFERMVRLLTGRSLGIALGGGGARGFAHIGLLQAMERLGLQADLIIGTSMGALVGALSRNGLGADEVRSTLHDMFVARNLLNDFTLPRVSLIRARRARQYLEGLFGETQIEFMRGYYACTTTNLSRAKTMLHDRGQLAHWVASSMSVPGIAPPVIYQGDVLVDGGVLAPVPSDFLADLGRGPAIASDVSSEEIMADESGGRLAERVNIFRILYRTATLSTADELSRRAARTDLYLRMPVQGVNLFDWERMDDIIDAARIHAEERLTAWLATRGSGDELPGGASD